ncbi:ATP-binding protein [Pirellulaceae bacterium]|nr:ATP-binding protein [Pirellulaceae bacterium]
MAKSILTAGYSVVVDATFLQKRHRDDFQDLANDMQVEFRILKCQAEFEELAGRIQTRQNDPSEATLKVLKKQIAEHEPLNESEQRFVIAQV